MLGGRAARVLVGISAMWLAGCSIQFDAARLGVPVTMSSPASNQPTGTPFKVKTGSLHMLWGLVEARTPSLQRALAAQTLSTDSVANLKIKVKSSFTNALFTVLTLGVFVPRTVTFEGTIIKPPGAP